MGSSLPTEMTISRRDCLSIIATLTRPTSSRGTSLGLGCVSFYLSFPKTDMKLMMRIAYTNFTYSDITVTSTAKAGAASGATVPGGRADLFETVATVTATITNSGGVEGAEVAQLYL